MADLLIRNARLLATLDAGRRELPGGWVAIDGGTIVAVGGSTDVEPAATETIDAGDCLVTPGLINTHHHIFQNLTRAYPPMTDKPLFGWLQSLYPLWRAIDEEAVHASAFVGLAELASSGCTTSTDHLYLHPRRRRRPPVGRDRGGGRDRDALPPDAGLDVVERERRWPATR